MTGWDRRSRPPEQSTDPGLQLPVVHRPGQHIIGTPIQTLHLDPVIVGGDQDDDRLGRQFPDLLERCPDTLTAYLNYKTHVDKNSLYNTPPVFPIYALKLVMEWVKAQGGVSAMTELAEKKSSMLYDTMAQSNGYYSCPVDEASRSKMNVVFRLPNEDLEKKFIEEATNEGMIGLKGHRSVGGCRASIYNAMPVEGAETLAAFMRKFAETNQ